MTSWPERGQAFGHRRHVDGSPLRAGNDLVDRGIENPHREPGRSSQSGHTSFEIGRTIVSLAGRPGGAVAFTPVFSSSAKNGPDSIRPKRRRSRLIAFVRAESTSARRAASRDLCLGRRARGPDRFLVDRHLVDLSREAARRPTRQLTLGHPHHDVLDEAADQRGVITDPRHAETRVGRDAIEVGDVRSGFR